VEFLLLALCLVLAAALTLQRARMRSSVRRLTAAILGHRLGDLRPGGYDPRAPREIRLLEDAIIEQLFHEERLEARVSQRDNLLAAVVEGLGDAVLVIGKDERVQFANNQAHTLFRWRSDPTGRPVSEMMANHELSRLFDDCAKSGKSVTGEIRFNSLAPEGGGVRILEVDIAPLSSTGESKARIRVVLRDITERREIEQVRKDFVANASHELRTPLTIINGYIENLLSGVLDDKEMSTRFLGVMQKHGARLARIIEDMLTISKLESSVADVLQRAEFDLAECARDVTERLSPMAEEKHARMVLDFPPEGSLAIGDRFYWDQILFNLVENALKENDRRGVVVSIRGVRDDAGWTLRVSDNGIGIRGEDLPFIFKRFFRGDKQHSPEKKGTGLGLSIVKRAVEAHGGKIRATSRPGIETTFTMTLPVTGLPSPDSEDPEHADPHPADATTLPLSIART